jgi:hypothetical protein
MGQFPFFERGPTELDGIAPPLQSTRLTALDPAMIERGAQALFEFVFACGRRLDGKQRWVNSDDQTKEGFRREAIAVIEAAWPFLRPNRNAHSSD